jgi:hypothetical protein
MPKPVVSEQIASAILPGDFIFHLTPAETVALNRSQNATGSQKDRDPRRKYSPHVAETGRVRNLEICT